MVQHHMNSLILTLGDIDGIFCPLTNTIPKSYNFLGLINYQLIPNESCSATKLVPLGEKYFGLNA